MSADEAAVAAARRVAAILDEAGMNDVEIDETSRGVVVTYVDLEAKGRSMIFELVLSAVF